MEKSKLQPLDVEIDIIGQQPLLKIYTQLSLCYSVADDVGHTEILNTLRTGLERLAVSFPWVAGQVVSEVDTDTGKEVFKIKELEKFPRLIYRDLTSDSMFMIEALRQANFPFSMLDESKIAPIRTLPALSGSPLPDWPAFLVQATFISGGLILTFLGNHQTMDMRGQGQMISLLSKACHDETFTEEELASCNMPRHNIVPFLDESYQPGPELDSQIVPEVYKFGPSGGAQPVTPTWVYFTISSKSLGALKEIATNSLPPSSSFISTDDALTAFFWKSITRARAPRLDASASSKFARAVDVRKALNVPDTYPGLLQNMTYHEFTIQELLSEPLGVIAASFRAALNSADLAYRTQALATYMHRWPEKRTGISLTATLDLTKDIMMSSWAKEGCYDLDFDLGIGKPEAVRRPRFDPFESLGYFMPRARDGEIAVGVCLREEDLERLRADEEFSRYAVFVG
jgi:hypothetical protein